MSEVEWFKGGDGNLGGDGDLWVTFRVHLNIRIIWTDFIGLSYSSLDKAGYAGKLWDPIDPKWIQINQ